MDFRIDRAINVVARQHPLLSAMLSAAATWGVLLFAAAAVLLWFLAPPDGHDRWKRAAVAGLGGGSLGLAVNQVIIHLWQRPRPYQAHPHAIIPLLPRSTDPSFPSDHASAAFGIAAGIMLVHRRAGYIFLAAAGLIALSRVATGMHYPTDVIAGGAIGALSGYAAGRLALRPVLTPAVCLLGRVTDPPVRWLRRRGIARRTLLQPRFRASAVITIGGAAMTEFAWDIHSHLLDELPLAALTLWAMTVAALAFIGSRRVDEV